MDYSKGRGRQICRAAAGAVLMTAATAVALAIPRFGPWSAAANLEAVEPGAHVNLNTPAAVEGCPAIEADERTLFFASNRDGTLDIWRSRRQRADESWGSPEKLPAAINKTDSNEFCPTPLRNGKSLLFVSNKAGGCGLGDIYITREHHSGEWSDPEHLPCSVNSAGDEAGPSLVEYDDGVVELYFSSTRPGGASAAPPDTDADIYSTQRRPDGSFGAVILAAGLSTASDDSRPNIRRDGLEIFFDSNRPGSILNAAGLPSIDIWTSVRPGPAASWPGPQRVENVNTAANEVRPFLSWDAATLLLGTTREGSFDLYRATRARIP